MPIRMSLRVYTTTSIQSYILLNYNVGRLLACPQKTLSSIIIDDVVILFVFIPSRLGNMGSQNFQHSCVLKNSFIDITTSSVRGYRLILQSCMEFSSIFQKIYVRWKRFEWWKNFKILLSRVLIKLVFHLL